VWSHPSRRDGSGQDLSNVRLLVKGKGFTYEHDHDNPSPFYKFL